MRARASGSSWPDRSADSRSRDLGLPDNGSYTRYADLKQPFVTWGVVAAPELSLRLSQWCFPVAGCVTYRGYYSLAAAEAYAAELRAEGLDVQINGVPAYSTLGWFDDPLLSTFINYPDAEVARLVFHELSHQVVYVPGDSMFNESFASAVEQLGVERWLDASRHAGAAAQPTGSNGCAAMTSWRCCGRHRDKLAAVYAAKVSDDEKREGKRRVFQALKDEYQQMRRRSRGAASPATTAGSAGRWPMRTSARWRPTRPGCRCFAQLFAESGEEFRAFLLKVGELAALDRDERQAFLVSRSDRLIGDETLNLHAAEPIAAPEQARGPGTRTRRRCRVPLAQPAGARDSRNCRRATRCCTCGDESIRTLAERPVRQVSCTAEIDER